MSSENKGILQPLKVGSGSSSHGGQGQRGQEESSRIRMIHDTTNDPLFVEGMSCRPTKKLKKEEEEEARDEVLTPKPLLLDRKDIWVGGIFPFLGVGHYVFVASICKDTKEFYESYFSSIDEDKLPRVFVPFEGGGMNAYRKSSLTDTFHKAAFSSLSCAKFWDENATRGNGRIISGIVICYRIAKYGTVQVLEWAHQTRGFPWDWTICAMAAMEGKLDMLEYAHHHGCPWNERICAFAAGAGHLEVLQYARDNGCPWDAETWRKARAGGNSKVLEYLTENACPEPESDPHLDSDSNSDGDY